MFEKNKKDLSQSKKALRKADEGSKKAEVDKSP
jgi:hypothetical protein